MENLPILSILIFLPMLGAALLGFGKFSDKNVRRISFGTAMLTFLASLLLVVDFNPDIVGYQFIEKHEWVRGYDINYYLGIDGISLTMILLTTLLLPICIVASSHVTERLKEYMIWFLIMEGIIIGVFAALDMVLFYLFFEAVLIPMFLIIGIWGGQNRVYAAFKFFLYTLVGSVLLLIAMIYMYGQTGTTDIIKLTAQIPSLPLNVQCWLWLGLFASFAVKVPMFPFHTWLPDAHVQAPTAGSVILAGVLLKLGAYGFIRFSLPMLPEASVYFADFVFVLSVIAVIYTSIVAFAQEDMKKLIAYSSVAHMGFVTIGIFSFNQQGLDGAIFQMISHGIISGALFMCVGVVYDRQHTREIKKYGGLTNIMPAYALYFMIFTLASVGLPTTSGFVGEFLSIVGAFQANKIVAALTAVGVIVGAVYMLWLYRAVMFGDLKKVNAKMEDLNRTEFYSFLPLAFLVIILGIYPNLVLDVIAAPVENIIVRFR